MQSELKPCPFCGSDRLMVLPPTCDRDTPYSAADRAYPVVRCSDCYTDVPGKDFDASSKSAVEAWNRRAALSDKQAGEVKAADLAVQAQHVAEEEPLASYFARQIDWSRETFGPALRTKGVIDHIRKELVEIEREPHDLSEWIDVVILAMDGFWRHGGKAADLLPSLLAKQRKNMARVWPNWRAMSEDTAIEHDRSCDDAQTECNHKGKGLAVMSWGACCKACGEPWPFEAALVDVPAVEPGPVFASRHNDETGECETVEIEPAKVRELREKIAASARRDYDAHLERVNRATDREIDEATKKVPAPKDWDVWTRGTSTPLSHRGEDSAEVKRLTRPILGIEHRTAQEVFDIMTDRIRFAATRSGSATDASGDQP